MILRQSTAVDVLIGPFVDSTDGYTAETAVSPSVRLSKNGQNVVAKNDATTPVHDENGYYNCELDATDTNTVGTLVLFVAGSSTHLPVRHEYQVIEESAYDAIYATGAHPTEVEDLPTNFGSMSITAGGLVSIGTGSGLSAIPWNSAWDAEVQSEVTDALNAYDPPTRAELTSDINSLNDLTTAQVRTQVDDALVAIHLDHLFAANYDPASPPGSATAWANELVESDGGVTRFTVNALENGPSGSGASAASIADAVWAEPIADHSGTAGSTAEALAGAGGGVGGLDAAGVRAAIGLASANLDTQLATIDGNVDAILVDTAEIGVNGAGLTAIPWNAAWDAQVQSEVTDALNAYDPPTRAELTSDINGLNDISAADVWAAATRTLTSSANFNDLSAAEIRSALGLASANLDTQLGTLSTHSAADVWSVGARTLTADTNIDYPTASEVATAVWGESITQPGAVPGGTATARAILGFTSAMLANERQQTATVLTVRNSTDTADLYTAAVSDVGGVATRDGLS
jgi:phage baseplate assembly protein W